MNNQIPICREKKLSVIRLVEIAIFLSVSLMSKEIDNIINDMVEVLNASQMGKMLGVNTFLTLGNVFFIKIYIDSYLCI